MRSPAILSAALMLCVLPCLMAEEPKELDIGLGTPRFVHGQEGILVFAGTPQGGGADSFRWVAVEPATGAERWRCDSRKVPDSTEPLGTDLLCLHGDGDAGEDALLDLRTGAKAHAPIDVRVAGMSGETVLAFDRRNGRVCRMARDGKLLGEWRAEAPPVVAIYPHEKGVVVTLRKEVLGLDTEGGLAWRWPFPKGFSPYEGHMHLWKDSLALTKLGSKQPMTWILDVVRGRVRSTIDFNGQDPRLEYSLSAPRKECQGSGRFLALECLVGAKGGTSGWGDTALVDVQAGRMVPRLRDCLQVLSPNDVAVMRWSRQSGKLESKKWDMDWGYYGLDLATNSRRWSKGEISGDEMTPSFHWSVVVSKLDWRLELYSNDDGRRRAVVPVPKDVTRATLDRLRDALETGRESGGRLFDARILPRGGFCTRIEHRFTVCFAQAGTLARLTLPEGEDVSDAVCMGGKVFVITAGGKILVLPATK